MTVGTSAPIKNHIFLKIICMNRFIFVPYLLSN